MFCLPVKLLKHLQRVVCRNGLFVLLRLLQKLFQSRAIIGCQTDNYAVPFSVVTENHIASGVPFGCQDSPGSLRNDDWLNWLLHRERSVTARSSKRYRPLVLCFTGGNA